MSGLDCDDLGFANQYDLPAMRPAPDPTWAHLAACLGKPQEWWFPGHSGMSDEALDVCGTCPVRADCLQHAVRHGEVHGIWGGRSERARARMRRASRGAA